MTNRIIYFNEELHKYTDDLSNPYISVTTLIGQYVNKFDSKAMAKHCALSGQRGNPKYKGKSYEQLLEEWEIATKEACEKGTSKHNKLELAVKQANGYNLIGNSKFINDRLCTIVDILQDNNFGKLSLDYFVKTEINTTYPLIFNSIKSLHELGYNIYAESGVFDFTRLISGLIDLLFLKDNKVFIIGDYKTNKSDIKYEAGYFEKDNNGNLTTNYIYTNKKMKYPLNHLEDSVGNHYALQLSTYAYLLEQFGLECKGLVLYHIRDKETVDSEGNLTRTEIVEPHNIKYLKDEVKAMINHYTLMRDNKLLKQTKLVL